MNTFLQGKTLKAYMALLLIIISLFSGYAQAAMVPTSAIVDIEGVEYSQQNLKQHLESDQLKSQLVELGVDVEELSDRIASLTPDEIKQLNAQLQEQPAGGIVDVLLTIFVIFIVTDMLCATDIFTFVKCINK